MGPITQMVVLSTASITINSSADGVFFNASLTILQSLNTAQNIYFQVSQNGGGWVTKYSFRTTTSLPAGTYTMSFESQDHVAGSLSAQLLAENAGYQGTGNGGSFTVTNASAKLRKYFTK